MDKPCTLYRNRDCHRWRQRQTEISDGAIRVDLGKLGLATPETSVRGGLCCPLWRVARLRREAEARRHTSQDHLCRHDRPARSGSFGTAVKMRAEDTSIAQTELDALRYISKRRAKRGFQ